MMTTLWDESYPPSLFAPPVIPIAGVTAGTPGTFAPPTAEIPANITALRADPVVGNAGTNKPGAKWAAGQYVVLGNNAHTFWDGTGWQTGEVPPVPTIVTVAPANGPAAGGTAVVLTGTGFTGATRALFDTFEGTAFSVVNATTIHVTTPALVVGVHSVVVQHPSGNATKAGGFTAE